MTNRYFILGATGGIGRAVCEQLSRAGAQVMAAARDTAKLEALHHELGVEPIEVDVRQADAVETAMKQAVERFDGLDGAVNCVGSVLLKPAHLTTDDEWADILAVNLTSAFALVRGAAKTMTQSGGSVVLVSSAAARLGIANHEAVAAAKAGVIGLTLSAAATYAARGLRFNCVAPGLVRTAATAKLTDNEATLKASQAMHALGRIGEPSEVAAAITWLLAPGQGWITGQVLGIDGGLGTILSRRQAA